MSTNRIGGDFDSEAIEAFRAAYAAQYMTPEDQDVHIQSGLPGSEISNTSPWIQHTGLWKYPSGKGPDDDLRKPFNPEQYYSDDSEEEEGQESDEERFTDEEIDALIDEILQEAEEDFEDETDDSFYETDDD